MADKQAPDDAEIIRKIKEEKLKDSQMVYISSQYPMSSDGYKIVEQIGAGMLNNKVFKAECPSRQNQTVAVKQIDLSQQSADFREKIRKEVQSMSIVSSSQHVVNFHCSFVSDDTLWIVMELQEGSIRDVLKWKYQKGFEDEAVIASILYQTLKGIEFLHNAEMIHRDIKAGNILFDKEGTVKLADFGVSAMLQSHDEKRTTMAGTWHWMAPEVIDPSDLGGYDRKADIWSLGITAIEMTFGYAPYAESPPNQVVLYIMRNPPPTLDDSHTPNPPQRKFTQPFKDFVKACLQTEPKKRPPASKLLNHKFFNQVPKTNDQLKDALLTDLPSLGERFQTMVEHKKAKIKAEKAEKTKKSDSKETTQSKDRKEKEKDKDREKERDRERDHDHEKERERDRDRDREKEKEKEREREKDKSKEKDKDKQQPLSSPRREAKKETKSKHKKTEKKKKEEFSDSDEVITDI